LGLLRVRDDASVLHAMRWPDEIRDPAELVPPPVEVSEEEIEAALTLMETMGKDDLEGPAFRDEYTEAMAKIIEAKREEKPLPQTSAPQQPAQVLDLMAALNESVQKAREARGERPRFTRCQSRRRKQPRRNPPRRPPRGRRRDTGRAAPSPGVDLAQLQQ
jgi:DNA end-binding protein Ku